MGNKNILYVEIEVMDKDTKRTTRGILGGFTQRAAGSITMGYLRIYPNNASNMYCVSNMYSIVAIITEYEHDHLECIYYENTKEDQKDAMDKITGIMKLLAEQGVSNGRNGVSLTDYPKIPEKFNKTTNTNNTTTVTRKNNAAVNTTGNNSTTYKHSTTSGWYAAKQASIIRITRKSKKPSKKKLERMKKATQAITKGVYKAPALVLPKEVTKDDAKSDSYVDYDANMENAWQGMHQPGFNYMD